MAQAGKTYEIQVYGSKAQTEQVAPAATEKGAKD